MRNLDGEFDRIAKIISRISYPERRFAIEQRDDCFTIHVEYYEADVRKQYSDPVLQKSRKWILEPGCSTTEIVDTCFAAVMRSFDHVVQEHFKFDEVRVYSPHYSIGDRLAIMTRIP